MSVLQKTPLSLLRLVGGVRGVVPRRAPGRVAILTYHEIGIGLSVDLFRAQMGYLTERARVVDLATAIREAESPVPGLTCAITFDDGYESVYLHAYPEIRRLKFPATIYLTSGLIGRTGARVTERLGLHYPARMLSWKEVCEMAWNGILMGSHLSEHGDLSVLDHRAAMKQLCDARREIESKVGGNCVHFAYPYGRFTAESVSWVREAGHLSAATTLNRGLFPGEDPLRLPRIGIEDRYDFDDFVSLVSGDWDFIGRMQTMRRPALRRAVLG